MTTDLSFTMHSSLTKLMVSHDLLRSTVTNQIEFDQRDSKSIANLERDGSLSVGAGFKIGHVRTHHFHLTDDDIYTFTRTLKCLQ